MKPKQKNVNKNSVSFYLSKKEIAIIAAVKKKDKLKSKSLALCKIINTYKHE